MLINKYKFLPSYKALAKDVFFLSRKSYLFVKNGLQNKTILFYPDYPMRMYEIYQILQQADYNITNNPNQKFDLAFSWIDTTKRENDAFLQELNQKHRVINFHCTDIGKDRVEKVFQEVFGYSSFIDPIRYQKKCVRKTIRNGWHDGKILSCPIPEKEEGFVYQILFQNPAGEDEVIDYRTPIFKKIIPFIVKRYKPVADRFNSCNRVEVMAAEEVFSPEEKERILLFCATFGLDYGELDIIRHQEDGRIYILDVNNTPSSPPAAVVGEEVRQMLIQKAAKAFIENFLSDMEFSQN
jgi:hypothetical protein